MVVPRVARRSGSSTTKIAPLSLSRLAAPRWLIPMMALVVLVPKLSMHVVVVLKARLSFLHLLWHVLLLAMIR